jgi:hypothetical protein
MSNLLSASELLHALAGFHGTDGYTRHAPTVLLTSGALYLAQKAECFWLFDVIASAQTRQLREKADGFQVWEISVFEDRSALVVAHDGGKQDGAAVELYRQRIPVTDFILGRDRPFKLFVGDFGDGRSVVIMLPSEY